jgi:hypothetical protein
MYKKFPKWIAAALAILLVAGAVGATAAYAQESTPQAPTTDGFFGGRGHHGGRGLPQAELEAAAKILGMTADELTTALNDGKTLEDLATEAGVELTAVQDAIKAAREADMRERIQQAVTDGTMAQEKADWLLEGLEKGFLDGPGVGFGFGPHGHGDRGLPPADQAAPTTVPATTAP